MGQARQGVRGFEIDGGVMPLIAKLPSDLEDGGKILKRREKAAALKEMWRDTYREVFEYVMPQRETFSWYAPGQRKNLHLYDSTGQQATLTAANNMQALLCPPWKQWGALAPGGAVPEDIAEDSEFVNDLQETTTTVFDYIHHSNFSTEVASVFLELMVGTAAMMIDEGEDDDPIVCDAIPLAILELEEGPRGSVETTFMRRTPLARNVPRMFRGMAEAEFPPDLKEVIKKKPDTEVPVIQALIYHPKSRHYYGVVVHEASKKIIWRWDYEDSCPMIVARASVVPGEVYGRGRAMVALPDIKTLNTMQEFVLRQAAMVVAGIYTGVTDGAFNPYNVVLVPGTVLPVASNDNANPSLRRLDSGGGDFVITDTIIEKLRENVRTTLLGPRRQSDAAVQSATEVAIEDRNRLWDMGAEYGRAQSELLEKALSRCVWILNRQGKIAPVKVDGRMITLKFTSPLARAQDDEDLMALERTMGLSMQAAQVGGEAAMAAMMAGWKFEDFAAWLVKRTGLDADLVRSKAEQKQLAEAAKQAMEAEQQQPAPAPRPGMRAVA